MTHIPLHELPRRRALGLAPPGDKMQDERLLEISMPPTADIGPRLERLDQLLGALWNHPQDGRVIGAVVELVVGPQTSANPVDLRFAADHVHNREQ
mgnify:CR=1 FL=1